MINMSCGANKSLSLFIITSLYKKNVRDLRFKKYNEKDYLCDNSMFNDLTWPVKTLKNKTN